MKKKFTVLTKDIEDQKVRLTVSEEHMGTCVFSWDDSQLDSTFVQPLNQSLASAGNCRRKLEACTRRRRTFSKRLKDWRGRSRPINEK